MQQLSDLLFEIRREKSDKKGRYVLTAAGGKAELTCSKLGEKQLIADHAGFPEMSRGTEAGQSLVDRLVEDACNEGKRIVPLCPFVNRERAKHPEWADVFAT